MNGQLQLLGPVLQNNQAIDLMREARYDCAVQTLASTLTSLSTFMRNGLENDDEVSFASLDLCRSGARFSSCAPFISPVPPGHENAAKYFVNCPLEVSKDLPLTTQTGETLSFIVVYNLALAWHLWGLEASEIEEKQLFLRKALNLYRLAHGIIINGRMTVKPSHFMALVSNTGHAHICLGDIDRANACFHLLLGTLMCVVDQGGQHACEFLDGFIFNVASLILEEQTAPAA